MNGYGIFGKRAADAVAAQDDMELTGGVANVTANCRLRMAARKDYRLQASVEERAAPMREAGLERGSTLGDLLGAVDVAAD